MKSQLGELQSIAFYAVNHAMFISNSARPKIRQCVLERFGFSDASEWRALRFLDEFVDAFDHAFVLLLPVKVVFPGLTSKNQLHADSFRSTPCPAFN
jgi:hypothetical protein